MFHSIQAVQINKWHNFEKPMQLYKSKFKVELTLAWVAVK